MPHFTEKKTEKTYKNYIFFGSYIFYVHSNQIFNSFYIFFGSLESRDFGNRLRSGYIVRNVASIMRLIDFIVKFGEEEHEVVILSLVAVGAVKHAMVVDEKVVNSFYSGQVCIWFT